MLWVWQACDHGAHLIVLDPRKTPLARTADLWLPVRPGTDVVVLNAMLRQIIDEKVQSLLRPYQPGSQALVCTGLPDTGPLVWHTHKSFKTSVKGNQ